MKNRVKLIVYGLRDNPELHGRFAVAINAKRFKNPHHDRALRQLTGLDAPVINEVKRAPQFESLMAESLSAVREQLAMRDGIAVGIYCHAGRHRSVVIANELAARLRQGGINVEIEYHNPVILERLKEIANP